MDQRLRRAGEARQRCALSCGGAESARLVPAACVHICATCFADYFAILREPDGFAAAIAVDRTNQV